MHSGGGGNKSEGEVAASTYDVGDVDAAVTAAAGDHAVRSGGTRHIRGRKTHGRHVRRSGHGKAG